MDRLDHFAGSAVSYAPLTSKDAETLASNALSGLFQPGSSLFRAIGGG